MCDVYSGSRNQNMGKIDKYGNYFPSERIMDEFNPKKDDFRKVSEMLDDPENVTDAIVNASLDSRDEEDDEDEESLDDDIKDEYDEEDED
jgi:hypothetical protein